MYTVQLGATEAFGCLLFSALEMSGHDRPCLKRRCHFVDRGRMCVCLPVFVVLVFGEGGETKREFLCVSRIL